MTHVNVLIDENNIHIDCRGHSGYANAGADIVCSGISTLMYSFCALCMDLDEEKLVMVDNCTMEDGVALIDVYDQWGILACPLRMLRIGIESIAEQYPQNIELKWGRKEN